MIDHLQATYSDIKTVKSRGVCQIVLEMPIEGMAAAFDLLGAPVPGNEVWVAVARIRGPQEASPAQVEHQPQVETERPPLRLSASAAIIGKEGAFETFMRERHGYTSQEPAEALRLFCGIESKRELDDDVNSAARSNFLALRSEYWSWLKCEEPV